VGGCAASSPTHERSTKTTRLPAVHEDFFKGFVAWYSGGGEQPGKVSHGQQMSRRIAKTLKYLGGEARPELVDDLDIMANDTALILDADLDVLTAWLKTLIMHPGNWLKDLASYCQFRKASAPTSVPAPYLYAKLRSTWPLPARH